VTTAIDNPILNSPYEPPSRHYVISANGPTGEIQDGRRSSESFIPIAIAKKGRGKSQGE
jgi:type III restriction enzyme